MLRFVHTGYKKITLAIVISAKTRVRIRLFYLIRGSQGMGHHVGNQGSHFLRAFLIATVIPAADHAHNAAEIENQNILFLLPSVAAQPVEKIIVFTEHIEDHTLQKKP